MQKQSAMSLGWCHALQAPAGLDRTYSKNVLRAVCSLQCCPTINIQTSPQRDRGFHEFIKMLHVSVGIWKECRGRKSSNVSWCILSLSPSLYCLLPSPRYPIIFPESTSRFCHCQLWHKTFYSSHMYLDPTAPNYARQQMEGATWFTARLHSSKTALMAYQRKLRWDKWHRRRMGWKKET